MPRLLKMIHRILGYYQPNLQALSLMRIALALVIIADLIIRGYDLQAFYGNAGVWPQNYIYSFSGKPGMWTLHSLFENDIWLYVLYAINLISAITFLIGYKTKASNVVLWLLTISFHNRNLYILQAGDDLLRLLLLIGIFLPWGSNYSIDKKRATTQNSALGGLAYLILIASVYYFTAALKYSDQWRINHSALYYALGLDMYRGAWADYLYPHQRLMSALTGLTILVEYLLPVLILWPSKKGHFRLVAFIILFGLHLSFALFLKVGLFYLISISAGMGLLPHYLFKQRTDKEEEKVTYGSRRLVNEGIIFMIIVLSLTVNFSSLPGCIYQPNRGLQYVINFLRIDQYWGMFAPAVPEENKWLVYMSYNAKGQQHDIYHDSDYVDFDHSARLNNRFKSDRWKKLAENVQHDYYTFLRPHYCRYFLKTWNREHPKNQMHVLNLYGLSQKNLQSYKKGKTVKKHLCNCDEQ